MSSKIPKKIKIFDSLVVTGFFLSLLPVRLLFIETVHDSWLGSFGAITVITLAVLYLTYKNKLGWFGRSIKRFFTTRHTKRKIILLINMSFVLSMTGLFIYSVDYADNQFDFEKKEILSLLPNEGLETSDKLAMHAMEDIQKDPAMLLVALIVFVGMIFFDFDRFSLVMWTINEISGGLYLNMATIILLEEIEVVGIFIGLHYLGKKQLREEDT